MCHRMDLGDGNYAIVCGLRRPKRRCQIDGCREIGEVECDYPAPTKSGTCDRLTCRRHAKSVGPDRDYCVTCALKDAQRPMNENGPLWWKAMRGKQAIFFDASVAKGHDAYTVGMKALDLQAKPKQMIFLGPERPAKLREFKRILNDVPVYYQEM